MSDDSIACGTCHRPAAGGADPRLGRYPGTDPGTVDDVLGSPGIVHLDRDGQRASHPVFADAPQVIGFGVYIWNLRQTERVVAMLPALDEEGCIADVVAGLLPHVDAVVVVDPGADAPRGVASDWLVGRDATDGRPTAYVCRGTACSLPIHEPAELVAELSLEG